MVTPGKCSRKVILQAKSPQDPHLMVLLGSLLLHDLKWVQSKPAISLAFTEVDKAVEACMLTLGRDSQPAHANVTVSNTSHDGILEDQQLSSRGFVLLPAFRDVMESI